MYVNKLILHKKNCLKLCIMYMELDLIFHQINFHILCENVKTKGFIDLLNCSHNHIKGSFKKIKKEITNLHICAREDNLLAPKLDSFLNHVGHHKCKISIPSVNVNNKSISIRTQCMWRISMCILQMSTPLPWTYSKLMSLLNKIQVICSWILYFIYLPMDIPWSMIKA